MPYLRILLPILFVAATAGCENRCYMACTDQTAIQNDYLADRNDCRDYAQDKIDFSMRESSSQDDKSRKAQLVSLFSQCMATKGWSVPDGKGDSGTKSTAVAANPNAPPPMLDKATEKSLLQRASECAFARQYAASSKIYAARAEACDEECAEGLRLAPDAMRPAACGMANAPQLSKGVEKW